MSTNSTNSSLENPSITTITDLHQLHLDAFRIHDAMLDRRKAMKPSPPKHRKIGLCIVCGSTMPDDAAPNAKVCGEECRRRRNTEHKRQINNAKNALSGKPPVVERKRPPDLRCVMCGEPFQSNQRPLLRRTTCSTVCAEALLRQKKERMKLSLADSIPDHLDERLRDVLMRSRDL